MTDNDKMREGFSKWLVQRRLGRLVDFDGHLIDCTAVFWEAWQAAQAEQSVPVVERNQCDGCDRGLQVCDDGLHRAPSGHPVMVCTRNKYTHPIQPKKEEK